MPRKALGKPKKISKTEQSISQIQDLILTGTILAIDPSTGSSTSLPGYAWFKAGELIESGVINLNLGLNRSEKLYEISRTLREDFDVPDILIVEYIPPVTYQTKTRMNGVGIMALQKAIGAILAARPFKNMLEIPAASWRFYKPDSYEKTDEYDAICLGLCAIGIAKKLNNKTSKKAG